MYLLGFFVALVSCFWWFWKRNYAPALVPKPSHRRQLQVRQIRRPAGLELALLPSLPRLFIRDDLVKERACFGSWIDDVENRIEPSFELALVPWTAPPAGDDVPNGDAGSSYREERELKGEERDRSVIQPSLALVPWPISATAEHPLDATFVIRDAGPDALNRTFGVESKRKKGATRKAPARSKPSIRSKIPISTVYGRKKASSAVRRPSREFRPPKETNNLARFEDADAKARLIEKGEARRRAKAPSCDEDIFEAVMDDSYINYYRELIARCRASGLTN